ncbi:MAG: GNAT family N-acetyltransferase [Acidobacteriota bacterium]|nr:GNAT family N-acetyltransferase [Acidobacteriota bacterium]
MEPVRIAPVTSHAELQRCVDLQASVWGYASGDLVPRRLFLLATKIGGQVFAAYHQTRMVGFALALPGVRDNQPYLHSHMLAVDPEYRDLGIGRLLKLAQREEALARGLRRMEWTFDPLEIKNSYFNLVKLGVMCERYEVDFYGTTSSQLQGGLPTDRLVACWHMDSVRVQLALAGEPAVCQTVRRVPVPAGVAALRQNLKTLEQAKAIQILVRQQILDAIQDGLRVMGYERQADGGGCFLLAHTGAVGHGAVG